MRKTLIALSLLSLSATPHAGEAAAVHTFAPNVGVVSDYLFRGVSQTLGKPALQGGIDYSHSSGLYAGLWGSSITWVKDYLGKGSLEVDLYGGFKNSLAEDLSYDVGLITYQYPGKGTVTRNTARAYELANPNTTELYGAITYKMLTLKYSHTISRDFIGWIPYGPATNGFDYSKNTRGSNYLELNASHDFGNGWSLSGHLGRQVVKNISTIPGVLNHANYTDRNFSVARDVGFGVVSATYSDTDAGGTCPSNGGGTNAYCWGTAMNSTQPTGFRNVARGTVVLGFKKTF